jgi:hypothetical protein
VPVAQTTTATLEEYQLLAVLCDLTNDLGICLTSLLVGEYLLGYSTQWHRDDDVLGISTRRACTVTILAILGKLVALIFKVNKSPILAVALKDDATTLTSVTTIGTSEGYEFLATEVARASTTVTRASEYLYVIYKIRTCHNFLYINTTSILRAKGTN